MRITYSGSNSRFFDMAFFDASGAPNISIVGSPSATQIVLQNSATGFTTTLIGTGFSLSAGGSPTGGTLTGATFVQGGILQATVSGTAWDLVDFDDALAEIGDFGDFGPLAGLIDASGPLTIDGSTAGGGLNLRYDWDGCCRW